MNDKEYTTNAKRTLSLQYNADAISPTVQHGILGMATEAGELLDAMKKTMFYGKMPDRTNIIEELGDIFWYAYIVMDEIGVTADEVKERNINKLRARYPDKFTTEAALCRDLDAERKVLEG